MQRGFLLNVDCAAVSVSKQHVTGNTCDANNSPTEGYGIWANGDTCRLDGNSVTANRVGIQAGFTTNTLIIRNSFRANTVTYYTAGQNDTVGPVIVPGNPITSNNPWANFGY